MSGLTTHSGLALSNLDTQRGLQNLASIDGMPLASGATPGIADSVTVSGAGSSGIDGTYTFLGIYTGRPWYYKAPGGGADPCYLWFDYQWRITIAPAWPTIAYWMYRNPATDISPPSSGWLVEGSGVAPAPTVL